MEKLTTYTVKKESGFCVFTDLDSALEFLKIEFEENIETFIHELDVEEYYWGKNPVENPMMEKYGWYSSNSQEEESGWMYEEGEEKYYEALEKWQEAESKTFKPEKTLIFEIL